jgi:hypothetical protein
VEVAACLVGAKAEAEARRDAMTANFMVDEESNDFLSVIENYDRNPLLLLGVHTSSVSRLCFGI